MRQLFSLYGPLAIQSFGLFIVIGIILFTYLFLRDPRRKKLISPEQYYNLLSWALVAGFIGGRLLYAATNWDAIPSWTHIFAFWEGGYSLLGGILMLLAIVPYYLNKNHIPIMPLIDLVCVYAPLLQSISRVGCFFAGCCYGLPSAAPWAIAPTYCHTAGNLLHPTQLYSAGLLLLIFLFFYFFGKKLFKKTGQITGAYLFLMSSERFLVDFWRGDREFSFISDLLSVSQLIALIIGLIGILGFSYFTFESKRNKS
jgi:phosphatidylglycerol:prolipoprotein diacylglycerol transferase